MEVVYYPHERSTDDYGSLEKLLRTVARGNAKLLARFEQELQRVENAPDLDVFFKLEHAAWINSGGPPIAEFRIPKRAKGGVLRLYFAFDPGHSERIVLLSGELKKKNQADQGLLRLAEKRYKEIFG